MTDQHDRPPIQVTSFSSFPVDQIQTFDITFAINNVKPNDVSVSITNPIIGSLDKQIEWLPADVANGYNQQQQSSKCRVSFTAPMVGVYTVKIDLLNGQNEATLSAQFQARAYDLSKVFINGSTGRCKVNESYEFGVDASEAGEGQLEIAVNEGEIPNQVQVLDNGKCIVNFVPEDAAPHVVDIKFNGHNVNGCPFVVQVDGYEDNRDTLTRRLNNTIPNLVKEERILVDSVATFALENIKTIDEPDKQDVLIIDPDNKVVDFKLITNNDFVYKFEFKPTSVGDYAVELRPKSRLLSQLPSNIVEQFPFSIKVFDYNKVIVSDVTDGVVGHPIYFFIDASLAGSGNLEIRVSSETRNVPNYPQSEANAKIRVYFTPTEAVEHSIDVKFNGVPVPNNPFRVKVAQFPQARLPVTSQDLLKYVAIDEVVHFYVDYVGQMKPIELDDSSCRVFVLRPDFSYTRIDQVQMICSPKQQDEQQVQFKIALRFNKIGPYKLFITVNNEILPGCPILSNVYNINEVKVLFEQMSVAKQPIGKLNEPVTFTVDASRAGEGTLALAVISSLSRSPLQTEVRVSERGHGLYYLTFLPTEFASHSIDMSFNDRVVPDSPFVVDIVNAAGESSLARVSTAQATKQESSRKEADRQRESLVEEMEAMNLSKRSNTLAKTTGANKSKQLSSSKSASRSKEDELLESFVVHGVSLKRTPVNSTGAFIIETNRIAQARDFDVLISDPRKNLVDVQCYLQQDGNLLAEWTPERVGSHKIEVLYKDRPVPGSPFQTESFDPSRVRIENLKSTQMSLDETAELLVYANEAGRANLEVVVTDPSGEEQMVDMEIVRPNEEDEHLSVKFKPKTAGKYKLNITFGGYEVPKSPVILNVRDNRKPVVRVSGVGIRNAEINRSAQFKVESSTDEGELKLRIECGDREIVPKVERRGRSYNIKYKPTDVGYAIISLYWDGLHIDGSPFSVPVNDLGRFVFLDSTNNYKPVDHQLNADYEARIPREVTIDTSKCGPGEVKAEAYCRANSNIKFSIPVNQVSNGRHKLIFTCPPGPEQLATGISLNNFPVEATYLIRFYYNNLAVPETLASVTLSPVVRPKHSASIAASGIKNNGVSTTKTLSASNGTTGSNSSGSMVQKVKSTGPSLDNPVVALRGHGLVEAKSGEKAEFTIDGSNVGHGKPEVRLFCASNSEEVRVKLELVDDNLYKATYEPQLEGEYILNVHWDGKQVAGCPISVSVSPGCDPSKVICTADSLKGGVLGEKIKTFIDTNKAGPGELTALCTGPQKVAFCELLDRGDGTFILYIRPQEAGRHFLTINYGGHHIPKSPFSFKVSGRPDPTKVRVYGPGVEHGVLSLYQSRFVCDTRGAGAGQLTVRIRGPKGAFRMETQRESQRDRTILCKYDPTEPGDYRIEIKWSGCHVPGSPFSVMIFDTQEELNRYLLSEQQQVNNNNNAKFLPNGSQQHGQNHGSSLNSSFQSSHPNYYSTNSPTNQQSLFKLQ